MSVVIGLPGNEALARDLARLRKAEILDVTCRSFPDGESYLRLPDGLNGQDVTLVCTLARPDDQILRLLFAAKAARDAGVRSVHLLAPYLAYMRQDRAFQPGEAVSARYFAQILSSAFDGLTTVQPHLHRIEALDEIFSIPTRSLSAAGVISRWIMSNVERPFIVGPDVESEPWVREIADLCETEGVVLRKSRMGDRSVAIAMPDLGRLAGRTPVVVDDIISSGATMAEACVQLTAAGFPPPVCVGVHALFDEPAFVRLSEVADRIVCTDSIPNLCGAIPILPLFEPV